MRLGLRAVGLADRIDVLAGQEDTELHKPDPDPCVCRGAARCRPADCVYVGDAVVDVEAARAAGMGAVAVTWGAG